MSEIDKLKVIIKDLLIVAENVEEHWYAGCLFCGYKEHRPTCSLDSAITKARHELKERVVYKGVEFELDNLTGLKSDGEKNEPDRHE